MRKIILPLMFLLAGCAGLLPPSETAIHESDKQATELALMLEAQAERCWIKMGLSFIPDHIRVESKARLNGSYIIQARRLSPDWVHDPFIIIEIDKSENGGSRIKVSEGHFYRDLKGSRWSVHFSHDVGRWLGGDSTCGSTDYDERRKLGELLGEH